MKKELRYERKFRIESMSLDAVKQIIDLHPASFSTLYPDRIVNNIYLDFPDRNTWNQNVLGWNERKKYRIRWYGDTQQIIRGAKLEIKHKHNELGWKDAFDVEDFDLAKLGEKLPAILQSFPELGALQPSLFNRYSRSYLLSFDQKFRLTLDRQLEFFPIHASRWNSYEASIDPAFILELKYNREWDDEVGKISQRLPFRQSKNSKYVKGILLLS